MAMTLLRAIFLSTLSIAAHAAAPNPNVTASVSMPMNSDANELFEKIEAWLRANAPPLVGVLNPPAHESAITAFELRRNVTFPPDVKRLYLVHNGESASSDGIFGCWQMLSLGDIESLIEENALVGIIPIFQSGGGDFYYVKSHSAKSPDNALREWWHENPSEAEQVSSSALSFFAEFVRKLQDGQYVYRPEELAALIDKDEL